MINFKVSITGTSPLLMHNGHLADPLSNAAKALKRASSPRTKTEEIHEEISRVEHRGALYWDDAVGPYIPGDNILRTIFDSAKKTRHGVAIKEGLLITTAINPLAYTGPRDIDGLWRDKNFVFRHVVTNGRNRIARTRPIFPQWATEAEGILDEASLNFDELRAIVDRAGVLIGLGDWRPRFGRFRAEVTKL